MGIEWDGKMKMKGGVGETGVFVEDMEKTDSWEESPK